jgi:hypothetical protein
MLRPTGDSERWPWTRKNTQEGFQECPCPIRSRRAHKTALFLPFTNQTMKILNSSNRFVSFAFWATLIWSFVPLLRAQMDGCDYARSVAATYLNVLPDKCLMDKSCQTVCEDSCDFVVGSQATTRCADSCVYTWQGYSVNRSALGVYGERTLLDTGGFPFTQPTFEQESSHVFTAGQAQGSLSYSYSVEPRTDRYIRTIPSTCLFFFNGQECSCTQVYCDDSQTYAADVINCSALEGGALINNCDPMLNLTSLSVLELLLFVPPLACLSNETSTMLPESPGTTMAPSMGAPFPSTGTATLLPVSSTTPAPSTMLGVSPAPESSTTGVPLTTSRAPTADEAAPTIHPAMSAVPDTAPTFPTAGEDSAPEVGNSNVSQAPVPSTLGTAATPPSGMMPPAVAPNAGQNGASSAGQLSFWLLVVLAVSSLIF